MLALSKVVKLQGEDNVPNRSGEKGIIMQGNTLAHKIGFWCLLKTDIEACWRATYSFWVSQAKSSYLWLNVSE